MEHIQKCAMDLLNKISITSKKMEQLQMKLEQLGNVVMFIMQRSLLIWILMNVLLISITLSKSQNYKRITRSKQKNGIKMYKYTGYGDQVDVEKVNGFMTG